MFKKISIFLVLVLVIGALSACATLTTDVELSGQDKAAIEKAYMEYALRPDIVAHDQADKSNDDLYLGRYNGAELVIIGGSKLYAYKDGVFSTPEDGAPTGGQIIKGEVRLPMTASKRKLKEIEEAWLKKELERYGNNAELWKWYWDEEYGSACYGKSNGYYLLCYIPAGGMAVVSGKTIAEYSFLSGHSGLNMLVYKNGKIYDLETLYKQGKISKGTIATIWETHKARFPYLYTDE